MSRVFVVGAGMGGLAVAARLAVKGHTVTVFEQGPTYGGKVGRFERDGFVFDTGPSLLTLPAVYRDLFLKTGDSLEASVDLQPVEPGFSYRWADGTNAVLPGVDSARAARTLGEALGGDAEHDWRDLMTRAARVWQLTREPVLEQPIESKRQLLKLASNISDVRAVAPMTTLRQLGKKTIEDPRLRMLLDRYATYTGSDPRRAPAALCTIPYVEQTFGAWHVGGGMSTLADALYERCLERKVDFEFNCEVRGITRAHRSVNGVVLFDSRRLDADIVVSDVDAGHLYGDLILDTRAAKQRKSLAKFTRSMAGFVIMLALKGQTPGLTSHNVLFPEYYYAEFNSVFAGEPAQDPAIYLSRPDDPSMHPDDDHEALFVLVNAPRHGLGKHEFDWRAPGVAEKYAGHILNLLADRGIDVRKRLLWREIRTPADLERDTHSIGGSIYGSASHGKGASFLRPANRSPVPGLFLVGGSAHPGGGLPLVGISAEIVANLIGRA